MSDRHTISSQLNPAASGALASNSVMPAAESLQTGLYKESLQGLCIQRKLSIGAVDDPLEHEADTMADKVMRMPGQPFVQRKCAHCEEEEKLQMKPLATCITPFIQTKTGDAGTASDTVTGQINTTRGSGSNMDRPTQSFMESRFGTDFSGVKIHTGDYAVQMSRELNAQAFTVGSDIYFNSGKYNPSSDSGKHLLAHELTHTVQQGGSATGQKVSRQLIQRSCNMDFSAYSGATCRGTIQVGATTISAPYVGYYHLFVLFTDYQGQKFYLRGGPGHPAGGGYGNITVLCAPYVRGQIEYDTANLLEDVYTGDDACNKFRTMQARLNEIENWHIAYVPAGPNSNSVIATLLTAAGLPHSKPAVPTPGFDMEINSSGTVASSQDHPTTFMAGVGIGNGLLLNAELQQRLHTFTPQIGGLPIPIPLSLHAGVYGMPGSGRVGGSLGLGTDLSLLNLPLGRHSPLGLSVAGGATAGDSGTGIGTEVGAYSRLGVYTDIGGRFRIAPSWQHNYMHNTGTGTNTSMDSFMLQLGYTF